VDKDFPGRFREIPHYKLLRYLNLKLFELVGSLPEHLFCFND